MPTCYDPLHPPPIYDLVLSLLRCVEVCEAPLEERMKTDEFRPQGVTKNLPNPDFDDSKEHSPEETKQFAARIIFRLGRAPTGATGKEITTWLEHDFPGISKHNAKPFPSGSVVFDVIQIAVKGLSTTGPLIHRFGVQPNWIYLLTPAGRLYLGERRDELNEAVLKAGAESLTGTNVPTAAAQSAGQEPSEQALDDAKRLLKELLRRAGGNRNHSFAWIPGIAQHLIKEWGWEIARADNALHELIRLDAVREEKDVSMGFTWRTIHLRPSAFDSANAVAVTPGGAPKAAGDDERWMTVTKAARAIDVNPGQITRAADSGAIHGNGLKGRARRVDKASVMDYKSKMIGQGDREESDAAVERKLKHAQRGAQRS